MAEKTLKIYPTHRAPCPYIAGEITRNGVIDTQSINPKAAYHMLIRRGFRRNGESIYRPFCDNCTACVSTRILVEDMPFSRSQKRCYKRNQDLTITINRRGFKPEYQTLYSRYIASRHEETPDSGIEEFFNADWCEVIYVEFSLNDTLIGVAVVDVVDDGLSAVYTFFDPEEGAKRSLGTFAILWQVKHALEINKPYVYLGYWIDNCQKMSYKIRFQPLEGYIEGVWKRIDASQL